MILYFLCLSEPLSNTGFTFQREVMSKVKASRNILLFLECMVLTLIWFVLFKSRITCFYRSKYIHGDDDRGNIPSLTCVQICAVDSFSCFHLKNN